MHICLMIPFGPSHIGFSLTCLSPCVQGVTAHVESLLAVRQAHGFAFGKSDLFVVVGLRAASGQAQVKHQARVMGYINEQNTFLHRITFACSVCSKARIGEHTLIESAAPNFSAHHMHCNLHYAVVLPYPGLLCPRSYNPHATHRDPQVFLTLDLIYTMGCVSSMEALHCKPCLYTCIPSSVYAPLGVGV